MLRPGFQHDQFAQRVQGFVLDGAEPPHAGAARFEFGNLFHHLLPSAGGGYGMGCVPVNLGQLAAEPVGFCGFVPGGDQTKRFGAVGGFQGFLFFVEKTFAVVGAPRHRGRRGNDRSLFDSRLSMNRFELNTLASSGRVAREQLKRVAG